MPGISLSKCFQEQTQDYINIIMNLVHWGKKVHNRYDNQLIFKTKDKILPTFLC